MFEHYLKILCTEYKKGDASNYREIRSVIDTAKEGNQQAWDAITEAKRLIDVEELDGRKLLRHPYTVHLSCLEEGSAFGSFKKYEKRFMDLAYSAPNTGVLYSKTLVKVCEQNALELAQYLPNFLWSGKLATALEKNISYIDSPPSRVADWIFCSAFEYLHDFGGRQGNEFDFERFPDEINPNLRSAWFEPLRLFSGEKKWPNKFFNDDANPSVNRYLCPYGDEAIKNISLFCNEFSSIEYSPKKHDIQHLKDLSNGNWSENLENGKFFYDRLWHSNQRLSVWMNILYVAVSRKQWIVKYEDEKGERWVNTDYYDHPYNFSNIGKHLTAAAVVVAELLFEVCQHNGMFKDEQVDKFLQNVLNYDLRINFGYKLVEMASMMNSDREKLETVESLSEYIANYRRERPEYSSFYDLDLSLGI